MNEKLKACPFCEGKVKILFDESNNSFDISCCNCNAKITGFYAYYGNKNAAKGTAIAAWNRRAQPDNPPSPCENCIHDGFSKSGRYLSGRDNPCYGCRRNPYITDNYAHGKEAARNEI